MNIDSIIKQATLCILEAGAFIRKEAGKVHPEQVEQKSLNNLVSYVDKTAESILVEGLYATFPEAVFLTEEGTTLQEEGEWRWVIDPLDGTTNFLHQIPLFAVSVALMHKGEVVLGWVYDVMHREMFFAQKGQGATLNGKPISVSSQVDFGQSLIATGFPYGKPGVLKRYINVFLHIMTHTRGMRRLGSAALDLAYVACGRLDGFYEYQLNAWDVAAGALIVQEAGGIVTDFEGRGDYVFGQQITASNKYVAVPLLAVIQERFL